MGSYNMYVVILSGGVGSRLWPVSRKLDPKPFVKMPNGRSILQNTFVRILEVECKGLISVTASEFLFRIQKEWDEVESTYLQGINHSYILEPFGRGTAAAIAMASLYIAEQYGEDELILILPSDHIISDEISFKASVMQAIKLAEEGRIVTFGIKPTTPETDYGYIEYSGNNVCRFVEKPSSEKAREYFLSGHYLWNSGMFCFKAKSMLREMHKHSSDILTDSEVCFAASKKDLKNQLTIDEKTFKNIRENSIDYAVMEKSDTMAVIPCDIGWSDIGNWNAFSKLFPENEEGNIFRGNVVSSNSRDCYVESMDYNNKLIATVGLKDLVIVDTPDALLVMNKFYAQSIREVYKSLSYSDSPVLKVHTKVHRPWGSYTVLEERDNFKIKRIEVECNASLSLQSHRYRSEHWVVVSGKATVINGEKEIILSVGESTYIAAGNKHRLSNDSSAEPLIIIEVQTGSYLGEDDIKRFEDVYGRSAV